MPRQDRKQWLMSPRKDSSKWRRFKVGITIPSAGLVIHKMIWDTSNPATTEYEVTYLCCGRKVELTHDQISRKIYNDRVNCAKCGQKSAAESNFQNGERRRERVRRGLDPDTGMAGEKQAFSQGPAWPTISQGE